MKLNIIENIYISEYKSGDQVALIKHMKDKEISERTSHIPYPYTQKDGNCWVEIKIKETQERTKPVSLAIREKDGFLIGGIGFDGLPIGKTHKWELGYWLARPYWNKGIMSNAVKFVCDYAFEQLELTKVIARCLPSNIPSAKVLEKCGFKKEGFLKNDELRDGRYRDSVLFALLQNTSTSPKQ